MRKLNLFVFLITTIVSTSCSKEENSVVGINNNVADFGMSYSSETLVDYVKIDFIDSSYTVAFDSVMNYTLLIESNNEIDYFGPFKLDKSFPLLHENIELVNENTFDVILSGHVVRVSNENIISESSSVEFDIVKLDSEGNTINNTSAKLILNISDDVLYSGFPFILDTEDEPEYWIIPVLRGIAYAAAIAAAIYDSYCDDLIMNGVNNCSGCPTVGNCSVICNPNPC